MSQIDLQDLFDRDRFSDGWRLLLLLLYTPIGLVLLFVRFLVGLHLWILAALLPENPSFRGFFSDGLSFVLGIVVKIDPKGEAHNSNYPRIVVSNSISILDHFVLYRVFRAFSIGAFQIRLYDMPKNLYRSLGLMNFDIASPTICMANVRRFLFETSYNIATQPEFSTTNGRVALLRFNTWPFSIEPTVQPVTLRAWRPNFTPVRLTFFTTPWWTDIFWFMFVPCTIFTVKCLKVKTNPDPETLAREVESDIANDLGLQISSYTGSDKTELEKRYIREKTYGGRSHRRRDAPNSRITPIQNVELQRMVRQVSEVLPYVPRNVILKDISKTRNVDVTIANILDGIVTYTPEPIGIMTGTASTATTSATPVENTTSRLAGISSFQEKKAKMIREAREKYMRKHGLTDVSY